jgi:hypothetical protein
VEVDADHIRDAVGIRSETGCSRCPWSGEKTDDQPLDEMLAARAVRNGDEHAIKFTEVMLSEYKLNPDPVYLAAAEDAIRRL